MAEKTEKQEEHVNYKKVRSKSGILLKKMEYRCDKKEIESILDQTEEIQIRYHHCSRKSNKMKTERKEE